MAESAETVSVRLPSRLLRRVARLASEAGVSRSELLREVVQRGLAAKRLERGLDAYRRREVSLDRAADQAGVPVTVFLDEARRAGVLANYSPEELRRDLSWADAA